MTEWNSKAKADFRRERRVGKAKRSRSRWFLFRVFLIVFSCTGWLLFRAGLWSRFRFLLSGGWLCVGLHGFSCALSFRHVLRVHSEEPDSLTARMNKFNFFFYASFLFISE